jgi:glycosyltransferase involved in cell wall biosynthesis
VPNGAPHVKRRAPCEITERFGLRGRDYVLWVGRLVPEKAPDLLIRAFRAVPTDVRLVIVGGSSFSDDYAAKLLTAPAADPRVLMTGFVYGDLLEELYSNAALYVQPSLLEGMPLTLLEAAAYRRPVIASDIGPHTEVLGHPGPGKRLVPTGDEPALSAAITEGLEQAEAYDAGAAALHEQVRAHYDWDAATERTLDVYRSVLDRADAPLAAG